MRIRNRSLGVVVGLALLAVGSSFLLAQASIALTLLNDHRLAMATGVQSFGFAQPSSPFAFLPFNASVFSDYTSASQFSTVGANEMGGVLTAAGREGTLGGRQAVSIFHIEFAAPAATLYAWTGSGTMSGSGTARAFLTDITESTYTALYAISFSSQDSPAAFSNSGLLLAGHRYQVYLELDAWSGPASNFAIWNTNFLVPEPSTLALLGFGLIGLSARGRTLRTKREGLLGF